jgi:hypothetical protein
MRETPTKNKIQPVVQLLAAIGVKFFWIDKKTFLLTQFLRVENIHSTFLLASSPLIRSFFYRF